MSLSNISGASQVILHISQFVADAAVTAKALCNDQSILDSLEQAEHGFAVIDIQIRWLFRSPNKPDIVAFDSLVAYDFEALEEILDRRELARALERFPMAARSIQPQVCSSRMPFLCDAMS